MSRLPLLLLLVAGATGAASEDWVPAIRGSDFEIHFRKGSGTIASVGGERIASALARLTRDGRIDERILSISEHDCRAGTGLLVVEPPRLEVRYLSGGGTHGSAVGDLLCLAFDL
jgi:hypothetical protein